MADRPTADRRRGSGSRRQLHAGDAEGAAQRGAGRRPLAPDGERKPRFPRRCAQIDAASSCRDWRCHDQSRLLTAAEKLQYEGYLRREETNGAILAMAKEGATIREIVRRTGYSRGLTRKVLRGQRSDVFRVRSSSLEAYLPWLDEQ
jgi:hypothetical protein